MNIAGHAACVFLCLIGGVYSTWLLWNCWTQFRLARGRGRTASDARAPSRTTRINWTSQAAVAVVFLVSAASILTEIGQRDLPILCRLWTGGEKQASCVGISSPPALPSTRVFCDRGGADRTVVGVDLTDLAVTDADVHALSHRVPQLQWITLTNTPVTDACLAHLKHMPNLRCLTLMRTHISDDGLEHVAQMDNLEDLSLCGTQLTDVGLERLSGMRHLRYLDLHDTAITDSGLAALEQMDGLEVLNVDATNVTRPGVERLMKRLPTLKRCHYTCK